ncbi:GH25 family lysozyme [Lactiplantibacillus nangangensis]|uniref:GH25 family lysozyme n=1 Tax=Lactiplantibacillus nangangensis TaxID=2559917 RepID=A0ABW1SMJ1_9LACO|nr:GH25 family lysozyme [Lactiplantibacillus nangangensis]
MINKLKSKLALTGAATMAALFFGVSANAATDNRPVYDFSEWQGNISAAQAKLLKGEAKGIILRVQYGSNYRDKVFDHNAAVLNAAGVKFGVYAFGQYVNDADAKVEATDFYNRAKKYNPLFYANDAEIVTTYAGSSYSSATKAFATKLHSLTTKPVYLYTGKDVYNYHLDGRKGYNGVWLAYYQNTQPNVGFTYELWQHTDRMYSTALNKSVDASKFVTNVNWFGNTVDTSKYPNGGYKVGDEVRLKTGITYYGTTTKADDSLTKTKLTVKTVKTVYTGTSSQVLTVYNDSKAIGQVRAQDVTKVGSIKPSKSSTSVKWVRESKTYTLKTAVKLRKSPSTSAGVITTLAAGQTVKTDAAIIQGGYRWVRQPRSNGYAYMATGPASNSLEYVKTGVSHAYYTVKFGDSWWAIAQQNGLGVYALASKNGQSIYSTIHPGEKLIIK